MSLSSLYDLTILAVGAFPNTLRRPGWRCVFLQALAGSFQIWNSCVTAPLPSFLLSQLFVFSVRKFFQVKVNTFKICHYIWEINLTLTLYIYIHTHSYVCYSLIHSFIQCIGINGLEKKHFHKLLMFLSFFLFSNSVVCFPFRYWTLFIFDLASFLLKSWRMLSEKQSHFL